MQALSFNQCWRGQATPWLVLRLVLFGTLGHLGLLQTRGALCGASAFYLAMPSRSPQASPRPLLGSLDGRNELVPVV
jgi:hypothetical protein